MVLYCIIQRLATIEIITDKDILKAIARNSSIASAYISREFDLED
jgi:hypothetical protein